MPAPVTMSLLLTGQFPGNSFPDWIAHRAKLLDLVGWVKTHNQNLIEIQVTGNQILIEALEAACSLGPLEVGVESIQTQIHGKISADTQFILLK